MATRNPERYRALLARLRQAREEAKLSQIQAAQLLETVQQDISRIETGERRIDPTELEDFAKIYGKPITYFYDGQE